MTRSEAGKLGALKSEETRKKIQAKRHEEYYKNPSLCSNCKCGIDYLKRTNKYCSSSCAAIVNGKLFPKRIAVKQLCKYCGNSSLFTYCNKDCYLKHKNQIKIERVELGLAKSNSCYKDYLCLKFGRKCQICNTSTWNNLPIGLILDHVDGNSENNSLDNLRVICSNCDMQLPTYKSKNKGKGRFSRRQRYREGKSS